MAKTDQKKFHSINKEYSKFKKEAFSQGIKGPALDLLLYTSDWSFDLKKIKAKVFLWYGEADKNVPIVMGKYMHAQIPKSKLVVYPNEGHLISITHAEEIFAELV